MPVSSKSISAVSRVRLAIGASPRAYITASAAAMMVPPTQNPSALTLSTPQISRATSIAAIGPSAR